MIALRSNLFTKFYRQMIDRMDPVLTIDNGEQIPHGKTGEQHQESYRMVFCTLLCPCCRSCYCSALRRLSECPPENEVFGSIGESVVENPHINPEALSNNLNIGFKAGDYYMGLTTFLLLATGFLRDTRDKIVRQINPRLNDAIQTNENLGKTQSLGIEAEANYAYGDGQTLFNLSRFNTLFNMKEDAQQLRLDYYRKQIPSRPGSPSTVRRRTPSSTSCRNNRNFTFITASVSLRASDHLARY